LSAYYFDSSALVKSYVVEAGTTWVRNILTPSSGHDIHALLIAQVEVTSAVARRRKNGTLTPSDAMAILSQLDENFLNDFLVIDVSGQILGLASSLIDRHALRAYDGVHLAAAIQLNQVRLDVGLPEITLVSADRDLNAAAEAEDLAVEDPNQHP